jgi:8-oxo-dGTP diphosphatase
MLRMVVGFIFCGAHVLLVKKQKPGWQKGLWNGVGGKCEEGELHQEAIVREVMEETGVMVPTANWTHFATEAVTQSHAPGYELFCYKTTVLKPDTVLGLPVVPSVNDVGEPLRWIKVDTLYGYHKLGNLNWLIPLAKDWRQLRAPVLVNVYDDIKEKASW